MIKKTTINYTYKHDDDSGWVLIVTMGIVIGVCVFIYDVIAPTTVVERLLACTLVLAWYYVLDRYSNPLVKKTITVEGEKSDTTISRRRRLND